jgi:biopolymer transport protein ExbD
MSMSLGGSGKGPQGDINVTPLIDVVLVLLIIFMVMTPVMLKELVANVPKKQDQNAQVDLTQVPIIVELTAKDEVSVNSDPVAVDVLADKVTDKLKHDRNKVVFFKVDDDANYGKAVRLMDICRGAGAKTLGIMTKDSAP